ncbi:hypothetical protein [Macromonas nakdongensis]|uniref:hypothetical protein n=1 Tax=Macromonas nakdongensis TaxID=1843082 RepID=UPI0018E31AC6|nr:hypothetical protein [Macromonas nakdongensis]
MNVFSSRPATVVAPLLLALSAAVGAQSPIYRCGNEYTNNPGNAQARGCRLVEGGNLTIVEGTRPAAAPAGAAAGEGKPGGAPKAAGARNAGERVDSSEQRARDSDARQILDQELQRAQERLDELREEYNKGQPERLASERSNPQRYQERVADLKARLERAESDVAAIQREIARLKPAGER